MTVELRQAQERIMQEHLASGQFRSIHEVLTSALTNLPKDHRFHSFARRRAIQRMKNFAERYQLSFGEHITRTLLHDSHRF